MKYNLLGNFNESTLVAYAVVCVFYGMISDVGTRAAAIKRSRFFLLRLIQIKILPVLLMFWKPLREIKAEMTYQYLETQVPEGSSDDEKASNKVTCEKKITNVFGMSYELDLDNLSIDQQPEHKDQFTLLDYSRCGRIALMKHFANLRQLTKEHLESTKDFIQHSVVTGYRIRVMEDDDPANQDLNLNCAIDGEMYRMKTPDVYVKLFPRCFTVYTSYQGSRRWWA